MSVEEPETGEPVNRTRRVPDHVGDSLASRWTCRWVRGEHGVARAHPARGAPRRDRVGGGWEHLADARAEDQRAFVTQLAMLGRLVVGIPADLVWRRRVRRSTMQASVMKQQRLQGIAFLSAVVVFVDLVVASTVTDWSRVDSVWRVLPMSIGLVLAGTIGVVATGLWLREQRRSGSLDR